jgi:hypothetical protein
LVVAKPRIRSSERLRVDLQLKNVSKRPISVTDAATGKPVTGAYVAIDQSGDAGGSNLGRFREQGIYVTGETDAEGRFTLEKVAFMDRRPFMVTYPGYVRHEQFVAVSKSESEIRLDVSLKRGATVEVTAVDSDERPLKGETWIRLESKAGAIFVPPREDWPRTTMRIEKVKDGRARFGELPAGEYSIDVMRIGPSDDRLRAIARGQSREEIQASLATIPREITYHSGTESISVGAGENIVRKTPPLGHKSEITIDVAKDPYTVQNQAFVVPVLSRDPGRLLWIGRQFFHPEDHRLGRILRDDFLRNVLVPGQSCQLRNFPPLGHGDERFSPAETETPVVSVQAADAAGFRVRGKHTLYEEIRHEQYSDLVRGARGGGFGRWLGPRARYAWSAARSAARNGEGGSGSGRGNSRNREGHHQLHRHEADADPCGGVHDGLPRLRQGCP